MSELIMEVEGKKSRPTIIVGQFFTAATRLAIEWQRKICINTRLMLHLLWQYLKRLTSSTPKGRRAS